MIGTNKFNENKTIIYNKHYERMSLAPDQKGDLFSLNTFAKDKLKVAPMIELISDMAENMWETKEILDTSIFSLSTKVCNSLIPFGSYKSGLHCTS